MKKSGTIFALLWLATGMGGQSYGQTLPKAAQDAEDVRLLAEVPKTYGKVALTFDDLPGMTLVADQPYVDALNRKLVAGLKRNHLPATGFVNEGKLDEMVRSHQIANLKRWVNVGFDLGNHTFSHESPNNLGAAGYVADIAKGEGVTRVLMAQHHRQLRYFRHPYLETGSSAEEKQAINQWLAHHHYTIAPVTIDGDDWEFAEPYDDALSHHDKARMARIRSQYLAYTERVIAWNQKASQDLFGRQIAFVMMLHDTRLNADSMDDLATILKRRRLRPVSLDRAMQDPAYRLPDTYVGKDGISWLERWALALHKELPWDLWRDPPAQIEQEYERNDKDKQDH